MGKRLIPHGGNDNINTPDSLAQAVVNYFAPQITYTSRVLEPCSGDGAFVRAFKVAGLRKIKTLEIMEGTDFFDYQGEADWIITNPPFSKVRAFLLHAYELADNIVFLMPLYHIMSLQSRLDDLNMSGFGVKEIVRVRTPKSWPSSGFALAAIHIQRGWRGKTTMNLEYLPY
jgi:hypothetical protein